MENETFRKIANWGSMGSAVLGLINVIICFVKATKIFNTELNGDIFNLFIYPAKICFGTLLYKVSIIVALFALIMMLVSYMVNTKGVLKILMIICKGLQLISLIIGLLCYAVFKDMGFIELSVFVIVIIEILSFVLYIIEREHRKTIIHIVILLILTAGSGFVYILCLLGLITYIVLKITSIFCCDGGGESSMHNLSSKSPNTSNKNNENKSVNTGIKKNYSFSSERAFYKGKGDGRSGYGINEDFICYKNSSTGVREFACHIKEYEEGKVQIINNGKRVTDIPGCKPPKK